MGSTADTLNALQDYRQAIDDAMAEFFVDLPELLDIELSPHSQAALEYLREYSTRPGKRIRGALASATYDHAVGGHLDSVGVKLGVVLELIQNYLLIVDDVMDKSVSRRGSATLQYVYRPEAEGYGGEHTANMLAINVGLLAQHFANLQLVGLKVAPEVLAQAISIMHVNISATGFGQLEDLDQQVGRQISEADIIRKYRLKSSYYTFVNPLQLGFTLGGKATPERLTACKRFGEAAGIAFQLHDDYLGIFGDAAKLGKPNLDDIREGKFTLLMQYALTNAATAEAAQLKGILGDPAADEAALQIVQTILTTCGARDYVQQQALQFAAQAQAELGKNILGDTAFEQLLHDLVDYSTERER